MPRRETAAQRRKRFEMLLAEYDARSRESRKLDSIVKGLKEQIADIPAGTYGEWVRSHGTAREITDTTALKIMLTEHGLTVPTKMSAAPVVVTHVGG